ncbi:hypothetical protein [Saccharopolyspora shandongensis]
MPSPDIAVMGSIPTWPDTQIASPTWVAREKCILPHVLRRRAG